MDNKKLRSLTALAFTLGLAAFANLHTQAQLRPIDEQEAAHIALGHLAGSVLKVERAQGVGLSFFEVEVRVESGLVYEVNVAADDGRVLSIVLDDD